MASFGERMRQEREKQGITLEFISRATKIRTHILEALENEKFNELPGGIFNKSFVRSYARFLGMDEEQLLNEFIAAAGDPEQPLPDPPVSRRPQVRLKKRRSWAGIAAAVTCAIVLLFGGWKTAHRVRAGAGPLRSHVHRPVNRQAMASAEGVATSSLHSGSAPAEPPIAPATDPPPTPAPASLKLASQRTTTPAPELVPAAATEPAGKFVILVRAKRPAWVSITADGVPVFEGVLERKKQIRAQSEVVLKTDNAGALAVSRNGKPLPPLSDQDQQTTVTFTPDSVSHSTAVSGEMLGTDSENLPNASDPSDRQEPTQDAPRRAPSPGSTDAPPDNTRSR